MSRKCILLKTKTIYLQRARESKREWKIESSNSRGESNVLVGVSPHSLSRAGWKNENVIDNNRYRNGPKHFIPFQIRIFTPPVCTLASGKAVQWKMPQHSQCIWCFVLCLKFFRSHCCCCCCWSHYIALLYHHHGPLQSGLFENRSQTEHTPFSS